MRASPSAATNFGCCLLAKNVVCAHSSYFYTPSGHKRRFYLKIQRAEMAGGELKGGCEHKYKSHADMMYTAFGSQAAFLSQNSKSRNGRGRVKGRLRYLAP